MRYAIWDKQTDIVTPIGEILTPQQWIARYPIAGRSNVKVVCSAGEINGGFFGTLNQMINMYEEFGVDFTDCNEDEEYLAKIEEYETADHSDGQNTPEERIAAALELNNLYNSPIVNTDDPDEL